MGDGSLSIDYATKFSRNANPKWAPALYTTYGQDATVENCLKPHFMDGFTKKEDYLYITTGYLQYKKQMTYSGNYSSGEETTHQVKIARTKNMIMVIPSLSGSHPSLKAKSSKNFT